MAARQALAREPLVPVAPSHAVNEAQKAGRATALGPQDIFLLDQWGRQLNEAFKEMPYLVGSVVRAEASWRDVDVRMLVPMGIATYDSLLLRTLNVALTLWGRQVTGLPIDFQMQDAEEFHRYDSEIRNPLGPRSKAGWRLASVNHPDS